MKNYLFAYRNGILEYHKTKKEGDDLGALYVGNFSTQAEKDKVIARARHGYNGEFLVTGVPEADTDEEALDAVCKFQAFLNK